MFINYIFENLNFQNVVNLGDIRSVKDPDDVVWEIPHTRGTLEIKFCKVTKRLIVSQPP